VIVTRLEVGILGTNTYLLRGQDGPHGLIIDPGGDGPAIVARCRQEGLLPVYIVDTHAHVDHIGANAALKDTFPDAQLCIGRDDAERLTDPTASLAAMFGTLARSPAADRLLSEGDVIEFGASQLRVMETPGHTPGSICLLAEGEPPQLFCGDLIFQGGVGRTDFPGGDMRQLMASIRDKVLVLPDETVLWPGHGPPSTVGRERHANPFLV